MSWSVILVPFLAATALLFLPGLAVLLSAGLRRPSQLAFAPLVGVALVGTGTWLAEPGIPWSGWTLAALTAAGCAVAFLLGRWGRSASGPAPVVGPGLEGEAPPAPRAGALPVVLGCTVSFLVVLGYGSATIGEPDWPSQTWDNVFHLNVTRYIMETGHASPVEVIRFITGEDPAGFYPSTWHAWAALTAQISGAPVVVVTNALALAVSAALWPLGAALLLRVVFGWRPTLIGAGTVLAAGFNTFPYKFLEWGVLYPNLLGLAVLPFGFAAVLAATGAVDWRWPSRPVAAGMVALAVAGMGLAHPNILFLAAAVLFPVLAWRTRRKALALAGTGVTGARAWWPWAALTLGTVLVLAVWIQQGLSKHTWFDGTQGYAKATGDFLSGKMLSFEAPWALAVLTWVGLAGVFWRRRLRWAAAGYLAIYALYTICGSFPAGELRDALIGLWYTDIHRIGGAQPMMALLLAVFGLDLLASRARPWLEARLGPEVRGRLAGSGARTALTAAAVVASVLLVDHSGLARQQRNTLAERYRPVADARLLDADEIELLERIRELVPAGQTLAASPYNGSSLAYAYGNVPVMFPTGGIQPNTWAKELVARYLKDVSVRPDVCEAVRSLGVRHVLDFGSRGVWGSDNDSTFNGLVGLAGRPGFTQVAAVGKAALYRVEAC